MKWVTMGNGKRASGNFYQAENNLIRSKESTD